jgi:hypothetical protein
MKQALGVLDGDGFDYDSMFVVLAEQYVIFTFSFRTRNHYHKTFFASPFTMSQIKLVRLALAKLFQPSLMFMREF